MYYPYIVRGDDNFAVRQLGAVGRDLYALRAFFDKPWSVPSPEFRPERRASLPGMAGNRLRAMGRLHEAAEAIKIGHIRLVELGDWENAARRSRQISEIQLLLGNAKAAVVAGERAVIDADRSKLAHVRIMARAVLGDAYHAAWQLNEAAEIFEIAEGILREDQACLDRDHLNSLWGYRYWDLLLSLGELDAVLLRANFWLELTSSLTQGLVSKLSLGLLDVPLCQLAIGRVRARKQEADEGANPYFDRALDGIHRSGKHDFLPLVYLSRAGCRRQQDNLLNAQRDLGKARKIVRRTGMRLFEADLELEQARWHLASGDPDSARATLAKAKALVESMGYARRLPEIEALEAQLADAGSGP